MNDVDVKARLQTLISDHLPEEGNLTPAGELQTIMAMPPDVRLEIARRLEAVDRFQKRPGSAQADAEAALLGMKRRNFYHMVARLRLEGPSRALTPAKAKGRRAGHLALDLGDIVEKIIAETLAAQPEAAFSVVVAAVEKECELQGLKPPSPRTIRLRLANFRTDPANNATLGDGILGREIFIDQTAAAYLVKTSEGPVLGSVTMVIDAGTRLILGIGAGVSENEETGLESAIDDWTRRKARLDYGVIPAMNWPETVHWIVPEALKEDVRNWVRTSTANDISGLTTIQGARRHGSRLLRSIGTKLGWLRFLPRSTGTDASPTGRTTMAEFDRLEAQEAFEALANEWNARIMDGLKRRQEGPKSLSVSPPDRVIEYSKQVPFGLDWIFATAKLVLDQHASWQAEIARRSRGQ